MIEARKLTKRFDNFTALDHIDLTINDGTVFGLVGTNGAGKSTFLKLTAGILRPDEGSVEIDGSSIFENTKAKNLFFYIPDEPYFFSSALPGEMMHFYSGIYPQFNRTEYDHLMKAFELPADRKISTYSKGMKKLLSLLLGLSSGTKYLFCDETFDGLDPVMRQAVKSLIAAEMSDRGLTPVITSHNLRELEDLCDHVGLLHRGGILLSRDLDDMKLNIHRIQCVLREGTTLSDVSGADVIIKEQRGSLLTLTVRGSREAIEEAFLAVSPVYFEIVPLSLEEIFISETEVKGYDIKKLVL